MKTCCNGHIEIAFGGKEKCPLCNALAEIRSLEDEINSLEDDIHEIRED